MHAHQGSDQDSYWGTESYALHRVHTLTVYLSSPHIVTIRIQNSKHSHSYWKKLWVPLSARVVECARSDGHEDLLIVAGDGRLCTRVSARGIWAAHWARMGPMRDIHESEVLHAPSGDVNSEMCMGKWSWQGICNTHATLPDFMWEQCILYMFRIHKLSLKRGAYQYDTNVFCHVGIPYPPGQRASYSVSW